MREMSEVEIRCECLREAVRLLGSQPDWATDTMKFPSSALEAAEKFYQFVTQQPQTPKGDNSK